MILTGCGFSYFCCSGYTLHSATNCPLSCFLIMTCRGHNCDKRLRLQSLTPVLDILPPKCIHHAPTFQLCRSQQDPHLSRGPFGCTALLLLPSCCDFSRIRDSVVIWLCKHHNSCLTTHHCCQSHESAHRIITTDSSWWCLFPGTSLQVCASAFAAVQHCAIGPCCG